MTDRQAVQIKNALEKEIVLGERHPGERLDEVQLAERFQVSRTPVREALQQLAATGLVERRVHRGAFVAQLGLDNLIEMFEVMAELEGMCARLAARRMNDADKRALRAAHDACEQSARDGDPDVYYQSNAHFHETIYGGCRNAFLTRQTRELRNRLTPYRRLQLRVRNRIGNSFDEHAAIVDAIAGGDGAEAERLARAHVVIQGERFSDFAASLNELRAASGA